MRTSVFLKAWELVKSLGMNLREALVLAWKEIKAETIWNTINDLEYNKRFGIEIKYC